MKPRKSILDPTFVYVPSHLSDLHKSFARIREQLRANTDQREQQIAQDEQDLRKVCDIMNARRK